MGSSRQLRDSATGKHIGHACEAHLRAALRIYANSRGITVSRAFEIDGQVVKPDAVLTRSDGKIAAVVVCAYWDHSGSSEKKYYRTRIEYTVTHNLRSKYPDKFSKDFKVLTFFYGSKSGWKDLILEDLKKSCIPFVFLPDISSNWSDVVKSAFQVYQKLWETGKAKTRELSEDYLMSNPDQTVTFVLDAITPHLGDKRGSPTRTQAAVHHVKSPEAGYSTRARQALGVLALVRDVDVLAWHANGGPADECISMARTLFFLDCASLFTKKRANGLAGVRWIHPRMALDEAGKYAPGKPDLNLWTKHDRARLVQLLGLHRQGPAIYQSMKNAARVQAYSNIESVVMTWVRAAHVLNKAPRVSSLEGLWRLVSHLNTPVTTLEWHSCHALSAMSYPLRDLIACSAACVVGIRSIRTELGCGRAKQDLGQSVNVARQHVPGIVNQIRDAAKFAQFCISDDFLDPEVEIPSRPEVLDLEAPQSLTSSLYNLLTTHPTHNPLGHLLLAYLRTMYPGNKWEGWPIKRSVPIKEIFPNTTCRREWQIWSRIDDSFVFAEVKSVTDNHWGDKSKEIYDRILDTREACASNGVSCRCICLYDGDFFNEAYQEMQSGIGYDLVLGVDECLQELVDS